MNSYLPRTLLALEECEQHLSITGTTGTSIESYLTQHILVILCAEMQQEIYRIVKEKTAKHTNGPILQFISAAQVRMLRSVKTGEICGFLACFDTKHKELFNNSLTDQEIGAYNNAITDRHDVAHRQGANITFSELKNAFNIASKILQTVNNILD